MIQLHHRKHGLMGSVEGPWSYAVRKNMKVQLQHRTQSDYVLSSFPPLVLLLFTCSLEMRRCALFSCSSTPLTRNVCSVFSLQFLFPWEYVFSRRLALFLYFYEFLPTLLASNTSFIQYITFFPFEYFSFRQIITFSLFFFLEHTHPTTRRTFPFTTALLPFSSLVQSFYFFLLSTLFFSFSFSRLLVPFVWQCISFILLSNTILRFPSLVLPQDVYPLWYSMYYLLSIIINAIPEKPKRTMSRLFQVS